MPQSIRWPIRRFTILAVLSAATGVWPVVSSADDIVVDVELQPTIVPRPLVRCITFDLWECGSITETVEADLTFMFGIAEGVLLTVPPGDYDCVTARDPLHTLVRARDKISDAT